MADIDALEQKLDAELTNHDEAHRPEHSDETHHKTHPEKGHSRNSERHPVEGVTVEKEAANEELAENEREGEEECQNLAETQQEAEACEDTQEEPHESSRVTHCESEAAKSKHQKTAKTQASKPTAQKTLSPTKQLSKAKQFDLTGLINQKMDEYDGLKDQNLQGHFCSELRRKHLVKIGLITKDGYLVKNSEEALRKKETHQGSKPLTNHDGNSKRLPSKPDLQFSPYLQGPKGRPASLEKNLTKVQYEKELGKIESKVISKK